MVQYGGELTPTGPKGEKRPADVIGNAVKVMRIATGEETDELPDDGKDPAAKALGKKGKPSRSRRAYMQPPHPQAALPLLRRTARAQERRWSREF